MKKIILIIAVLFSSFTVFSQDETTTYYLIRHAEKVKTDTTDKDPTLNNEGIKRSENWVKILSDVSFDAVYSTDYKRTKQTAKFIADSKELPILGYNPRNMFDDAFKYNTKGKTILIVGHSNTTPSFANKILGTEKYPQIDETNNGNLYIITVIGDKKTSTLLKIN
ncbi:phosphoglycerate mutase family protein [Tenacibaculum aquimarinum]|uniref:phosphoglycerate mutase family protein n=1 Tax=Tenacibaculum aquimarinum TaxID=2910675 RepID=UPI001F0B055F|nr:phosphoglycerate mutase family protein [Tenacibaculum aquimarinum]MCH3885082.1 histidine phosphatase family protein [Tenacibaculum aquimarinum]